MWCSLCPITFSVTWCFLLFLCFFSFQVIFNCPCGLQSLQRLWLFPSCMTLSRLPSLKTSHSSSVIETLPSIVIQELNKNILYKICGIVSATSCLLFLKIIFSDCLSSCFYILPLFTNGWFFNHWLFRTHRKDTHPVLQTGTLTDQFGQ